MPRSSAKPGPRTNKNSGVPFDPIKENGRIFVDWPKPKLALVITGQQEGYLEPCGCAGLDRMKGGMSRRYALFRQLRQKEGWPVVGLDVGGIAKGFGKQAELKFQIAVNAMSQMRYSAVTFGLSDLHLPTAGSHGPDHAGQRPAEDDVRLRQRRSVRLQRIAAAADAVDCRRLQDDRRYGGPGKDLHGATGRQPRSDDDPPEKLLNAAVPLLKTRANYLILLAHATRKEAIELGKKYPDFNLVICSGRSTPREPPAQAEEIRKDGTLLIEVGEKGMYAVVLGMYDDPQKPLRYQRVTLDSRFPASPEMVALMSAYQGQLKDLGLSGLGIHPRQQSAQTVQRRLCRQRCLPELPRRVVSRLEEEPSLPRLCHAQERQSLAGIRSGMHRLPYRRLESYDVRPLSKRIHQRDGNAQADQRRL